MAADAATLKKGFILLNRLENFVKFKMTEIQQRRQSMRMKPNKLKVKLAFS